MENFLVSRSDGVDPIIGSAVLSLIYLLDLTTILPITIGFILGVVVAIIK